MIIISVEYSNKDTRKGADPVPKTFTEASIPISQHFLLEKISITRHKSVRHG